MMTLETFLTKHNHAPFPLHEIAGLASGIADNERLSGWAANYLEARERFEQALDSVGFEVG